MSVADDDTGAALPAWADIDLPLLLTLDEAGPGRFRSRHGDANLNGRAYGGQLLGQSMMAASRTVDPSRPPTMMQFLFLQGTDPSRPVEFEVSSLQDGKRFSSRHVRATQAGRAVLDAHATFAAAMPSPSHAVSADDPGPPPEGLPDALGDATPYEPLLRRLSGYSLRGKPGIDFRIPDMDAQVDPARAGPTLRFWLKSSRKLADGAALHASAFAYLSDWWLNFSTLGLHVRALQGDERLYISSLNHAIWFHRPLRADAWLRFEARSPSSAGGRGLALATVFDRAGQVVATTSQECLMALA